MLDDLAPLAGRFAAAGRRVYLVGGTVRDLLLDRHRPAADYDLTTDARPDETKQIVAGWAEAVWTQGERFGTIGARREGRSYEITTHRAEAYDPDSRKPQVVFGDSVETDLSRRDFPVNAMAIAVGDEPELIDPFGGATDLMSGRLRTPLAPEASFSDDPLRMLRAARFAAGYGLEPAPELISAVAAMRQRMEIVSAERIRDELDKLMTLPSPSAGLWFLVDTGLAEEFLPELPAMRLEQDPIHRHKDVLSHTIAVVENVRPPGDAEAFDFRVTRLAALFHDVGKPKTRSYRAGRGVAFYHHELVGARMTRDRMQALRYSAADVEAVTRLVELHLRFHTYRMGWTDSAVRRYVRDAGPLLAELNVLTRCDCTTRNEQKARMLAGRMDELEARIEEVRDAEELAAIRPELDGTQVMEQLGIEPGPQVGEAMAFLLDVRLDEGLLGEDEVRRRLAAWWSARPASP